MAKSNRMKWPYPSEHQDPWFAAFDAFVSSVDVSVYASREDRQLLLFGGGLLSFSSNTGVFSWGSSFYVLSPLSGFLFTITAGSLTLEDGQIGYVDLVRNPTSNSTLVFSIGTQIPSSDTALGLVYRSGSNLYFRNGTVLLSGISSRLMSTPVSAYARFFVPSPRTVTGTTEIQVGHVRLTSGALILTTMLGSALIGDTAILKLYRESDDALIGTVNGGAGLLREQTSSVITVSQAGLHYFTLANSAAGDAVCSLIELV